MTTQIVSTGYQYPLAVISNGVITGNEWQNTDKLLLSDLEYGTSNPDTGAASDVILGNYNLNIPQNSVITGIQIKLLGYRGPQTSPPITLQLVAVDDTSGTNEYYPDIPFAIPDEVESEYILGGQNFLFSTAWTVDMINNIKLGLVANGEVYVDTVLVEVFYYDNSPVTPVTPTVEACENCQMPIQVPPLRLAKPFKIGDTKFTVYSFNFADGRPVQVTDLAECGLAYAYFTFDQGKINQNGSNFMENARCYSWTTLPNGFVEFDLVSVTNRALDFKLTGAHNPDLQSDHQANSEVVLSDSVPMMANYVRRCQEDTVFSRPIYVLDENALLTYPMHFLDVEGGGGSIENDITDPYKKILRIPGAGGTTPPQVRDVTKFTSFNIQVDHGEALLNVSGLNRGAVIQVFTEELATINSVEVGGVPCTMASSTSDAGTNQRNEIWYCVNPPLGAQLVTVDLDIPAYLTFGAEALAQVDTADMIGTVATPTNGTSFNPLITLTTDRDNSIIIDSLGTAQTPILYTQGAGQALNWSYVANNVTRQGGSSVEPAGLQPDNIVMDYNITQNTFWTMCAVEIHGITTSGVAGVTSIIAGPNISISSTGPGGTGDVTISATGGGGSGSSTSLTINQVAHGLAVNNVIGSNNVDGEYKKVIATTVDNTPLGFVTSVVDPNHFVITVDGYATIDTTGMAIGDIVFHSPTVNGGYTNVQPASSQVTTKLGVVTGVNQILIDIDDCFTGSGSGSGAIGTKFVGVGEVVDKKYYNIQMPFSTDNTGADLWQSISGAVQSFALWNTTGNGDGVTLKSAGGLPSFLPTSGAGTRKFNLQKETIVEDYAYIDPTEASAAFLGLVVLGSGTHPDVGSNTLSVGFVRDSSGNWYIRSATGSAHTDTAITAPSNEAHIFRIEYDPVLTEARFFIDGVSQGTITTTLPTASSSSIGMLMINDVDNSFEYGCAPSFALEM